MTSIKRTDSSADINFIVLEGRLDMSGVQDVELKFTSMVDSNALHTIVDISKVDFLASLGMRMFLSTAKALKKNDASLVLLNPAPLVKEALDSAGFGGIIKTAESIDEAEAFLKG